ncbi:hypothetical protein [Streptomyces griseorubiginosus]|uniref:hypothetical protein n=1 Tax=Streptomyces griseorubiginosus TaxID=67304 RepID=UPI001AD7DFE3|nr:hypothetical protein [Streptomyces griseorubiginosus]MBO4259545.1 hypothetical protein [Streptomyces griseorubiginosus]
MTTARSAFTGFFDDAAIFPPGSASLPDAVRAHLARRSTSLASLVGPFLLTLDRVSDAARLARDTSAELGCDLGREPLRVGLVVAPGTLDEARRLAADPPDGLVVSGLEVKTDGRWRDQLRAAADLAAAAPYGVHLELGQAAVEEGGVALLGGTRARLKFRTGGLDAGLFPTVRELAAVISAAAAARVPFKLTAGLHRAIRHTGPETGFPHHGFLNIALATAMAQQGASPRETEQALSLEDHDAIRRAYLDAGTGWRATFESFGTCSILEPVESLVALGLLDSTLLPAPRGGHV